MTEQTPINAVIISFNTRKLTLNCIQRLEKQIQPLKGQIIVVDNGSTDGTSEWIRNHHPSVHLIENIENRGFGSACNQAVRLSQRAVYYLFVNSDTDPKEGVIEQMLSYMEQHPHCAMLGPRLENEDGSMQHSFANCPNLWNELFTMNLFTYLMPHEYPHKRHPLTRPIEVPSLVGAFMMIRGDDFLAVKGFDERYFFFFEETDLCRRLIMKNRKVIYHPDLTVRHFQGASADQNPVWARYEYHRSKYQFLFRWEGRTVCLVVYVKTLLSLLLKWPFYAVMQFLTLNCISKMKSKTKTCFHLLLNHVLGFPPYLPLLKVKKVTSLQGSWIKSNLDEEKNKGLLEKIRSEHDMQLVKRSPAAMTYSFSWEAKSWIGKFQHDISFFKKWRGHFGRKNFINSLRLNSIGISVPYPIAYGTIKDGTQSNRRFFISEAVPESEVLNFFYPGLKKITASFNLQKEKRRWIKKLANTVRGLHDRFIFHHDLKASNILFRLKQTDSGTLEPDWSLIDLEKVSYGFFFTQRLRLKNLVQLNKSFPDIKEVTNRDRHLFLYHYLKGTLDFPERKKWAKIISRWTNKILIKKGKSPLLA
ncbi:MAG: glycosyltransferase [Candidatus Aureabacteria bacterium]|nr:glycosyltransferase [Candidatus Auribacterota bacterium]